MVYFLDIKSKYKKKQKSVKIRFLDTNKFGHVDKVPAIVKVPSNIKEKSYIVIETEKGEELVKVLGNIKYDKNNPSPYKFLRTASKKDRQTFKEHEKEAVKALYLCKYLAEKLGLKMNLLKAYIPLNRSKIIFYYVSESRVDFRELVRELAKRLKMRIEMRQVGVRDGVQILGAVGVCGNVCCCHNFIEEFEPVNVEMIAEQNLPPLTAKYTGICGRLMCCLAYEKDNYLLKKELPPVGAFIELDNKFYTIKNYDFIKEIATLLSEDGTQETIPLEEFKEKEIKILRLPEDLNPDCKGNCDSCDCPAKSMQGLFGEADDTLNGQLTEEKVEENEVKQSEISITLFENEKEEDISTIDNLTDILNNEEKLETDLKESSKIDLPIETKVIQEEEKPEPKEDKINIEEKSIDEEEVKSKVVEILSTIVKTKDEKEKTDKKKKFNKKKSKKNKRMINFKPKKHRKGNKSNGKKNDKKENDKENKD